MENMTRAEVVEMLEALKKCKLSIINGEAQSYTVGHRQVEFLRLADVNQEIRYYESKLRIMDGHAQARGVKTVIPLDT